MPLRKKDKCKCGHPVEKHNLPGEEGCGFDHYDMPRFGDHAHHCCACIYTATDWRCGQYQVCDIWEEEEETVSEALPASQVLEQKEEVQHGVS